MLDGEGYVATNAHVVLGEPPKFERARSRSTSSSPTATASPAKIVGTDLNADVGAAEDRPRGARADAARSSAQSHDLRVGAPVAAIGSPFGEEQSLSIGVISALDRDIESLTQFRIGDAIQTDAAINRGNSGGPLLDARGRVLGINSQIKSSSGGGEGVGFAVPVDTVRRSLTQLRETGKVEYGFLGVSASPLYPQLAAPARACRSSAARSSARSRRARPPTKAGLSAGKGKTRVPGPARHPDGGDVIVAVDGRRRRPDARPARR